MNTYHATPYDLSATGFYFEDYEDFRTKAAKHRNSYGEPVEEYEIQFIDGENYELFDAIGINQANLELWFDKFEDLDGNDLIAAIYLARDIGYKADELLDHAQDIYIFEGTAEEYAQEYLDDTGLLNEIPENLRFYFDVKAFARDLVLGGDICEARIQNTNFIIQEG